MADTLNKASYEIGQVIRLSDNVQFRVSSVAKTETSGDDWEVRGEATVSIPEAVSAEIHETKLHPDRVVTHYSIVINGGPKILMIPRVWPKDDENTGEKSFLIIDEVVVTD